MKKGLTELVFILDQSGSMFNLAGDTIGGFNAMIDQQKKEPGEALVSTVLFSNNSVVIHDRVSLDHIPPLTERDYRPSGSTALLDAIGGAIHHIRNVHKYARAEDIPEHTLFVITTDGMENASRTYSIERVREMIKRQKDENGWDFLFLGANIDAIKTAGSFGIDINCAANYCGDSQGTRLTYDAVGSAVSAVRACAPLNGDWKKRVEEDHKNRK